MLVRSTLLVTSRVVARLVDPAAVSQWLVNGSRDRSATAARAAPRIDALVTPEPVDVVANWLRGRVLLGLPGRPDRPIEYRWDPVRGVIDGQSKHIPKRLRTLEQRAGFEVRIDDDFAAVLEASRREEYTWITDQVKALYLRLDAMGFTSSISVLKDGELVGGLWGIEVGTSFGLMSVFHRVDHAGSMALIAMVDQLGPELRWHVVETGLLKPSFERFGAYGLPAEELTARLLDGIGRRRG